MQNINHARVAERTTVVLFCERYGGWPTNRAKITQRQGGEKYKKGQFLLVQTASVNVDCRKAEWLECFVSCIIGCHTPARVVKEDEESRNESHGTPKHNSELCSRIAHYYPTERNRHFWRDTTDTLPGSSQDGD